MRLTVAPHRDQPEGAFDNGAIRERKPIGFPRDGGPQRAVSTLFYWAHAWSPRGGLIDLHPHQGFEILTFVLTGSIQHYDSAGDRWRPIAEGGAQIIRSGSGISHAERLEPGAAIFQIWVDPDLRRAIRQPPSYTDYPPERFGVTLDRARMVKTYAGPDGPIEMDTPGIAIREYWLEPGAHELGPGEDRAFAAFLRDGEAMVGDAKLAAGDFVVVREAATVPVHVATPSRLFVVTCPETPGYRTFASMRSL
jgi:redox-sensitive bicupin YhaK (pirin superfamily)